MYSIQCTSDIKPLFANTKRWDAFSGGVPFRQVAWLEPWWDEFQGKHEAYILVATNQSGALCGLLPLYRKASSPQTLCGMGDNNACTDFVSILAAPAEASRVCDAIADFLIENAHSGDFGWDFIEIDGVSDSDPIMHRFSSRLKREGAIVEAQSRMHSWFLQSCGSWDALLKNLSKRSRRKINSYLDRFESNDQLEIRMASSEREVDEFTEALIELHQRRWNEAGQRGTYADQCFRKFIFRVAKQMFREGRLYLPVLRFNGAIIGAELGFISGDKKLYIYSSGYDLDHAELEPGRILNTQTLKFVHEHELFGIEFMRGDEEYKQRSGAKPTRVLQMLVVAPRWWAKIYHTVWLANFELKQWVRRRIGREPVCVVEMAITT